MDLLAALRPNFHPVYTIAGDRALDDAVKLMTAKKAAALIVTVDGEPAGIFTERDVFRYYQQAGNLELSKIKLEKIIPTGLIAATPTDKIAAVINRMIRSDIHHLPVMDKKTIIGVLALKDLVAYQMDLLTAEIHELQDYIDDLHAAGQD